MKTLMLIIPLILFWSCDDRAQIADPGDYEAYLSLPANTTSNSIEEEIAFWSNRINKNSNDEVATLKLAGAYSSRFGISGLIEDIQRSDSLYRSVLNARPSGCVEIFHSLATNAITQHQFSSARFYVEKAIALGDKKATSMMILTDVSIELGDYATARRTLQDFRNKSSFAYLIRELKLKDHEGDLDAAIRLMEQAYDRIDGNKEQAQWALSNLADMYGHAGRIPDAYQTYLAALKTNPNDDHALKGIARISLAHDHNPKEAKRIANVLASRKRMPEACLLLAEIASFEGDHSEKMRQLKEFKSMVSEEPYKTMYHKYLALIEAEDFENPEASEAIATAEIANRPTPQSYDLLAWSLYHQGKFSQALDLARRSIEGQTSEPDAYYHLGMIYFAAGDDLKSKWYLNEALKSKFELGPSVSKKIEDTLKAI